MEKCLRFVTCLSSETHAVNSVTQAASQSMRVRGLDGRAGRFRDETDNFDWFMANLCKFDIHVGNAIFYRQMFSFLLYYFFFQPFFSAAAAVVVMYTYIHPYLMRFCMQNLYTFFFFFMIQIPLADVPLHFSAELGSQAIKSTCRPDTYKGQSADSLQVELTWKRSIVAVIPSCLFFYPLYIITLTDWLVGIEGWTDGPGSARGGMRRGGLLHNHQYVCPEYGEALHKFPVRFLWNNRQFSCV